VYEEALSIARKERMVCDLSKTQTSDPSVSADLRLLAVSSAVKFATRWVYFFIFSPPLFLFPLNPPFFFLNFEECRMDPLC
jgi:hypothetical protein